MRIYLIGGFLGSGKTTAIINACKLLIDQGNKVAVITNDQGTQQVDSAYLKRFVNSVREVAGGCFCCNYEQLDEHIQSIIESEQPDVIFAESVGSCTDLIATIAKPLAKFRPDIEIIISIFSDITLFKALLEGTSHYILEKNVRYIYNKQLKEADVLVINKLDLVSSAQLKTIKGDLEDVFPDKMILYQNSLQENDIQYWLDRLAAFQSPARASLDIDYELYGAGEAELAWLDQSLEISSADNAVVVAEEIINELYIAIREQELAIGHLKFFVATEEWEEKISFTTMSREQTTHRIDQPASSKVHLLINARVQTIPEWLYQSLNKILEEVSSNGNGTIKIIQTAAFQPGFPKPTHRI